MSFNSIKVTPKKGDVVNEGQCFTVDVSWKNDVCGTGEALVEAIATAKITNTGTTAKFYGSTDTNDAGLEKTIVCPIAGGVYENKDWDFQFDIIVGNGIGTVKVDVTIDGWDDHHFKLISSPNMWAKNDDTDHKTETISVTTTVIEE
jgi:hypothetical protein